MQAQRQEPPQPSPHPNHRPPITLPRSTISIRPNRRRRGEKSGKARLAPLARLSANFANSAVQSFVPSAPRFQRLPPPLPRRTMPRELPGRRLAALFPLMSIGAVGPGGFQKSAKLAAGHENARTCARILRKTGGCAQNTRKNQGQIDHDFRPKRQMRASLWGSRGPICASFKRLEDLWGGSDLT
jgi:hypothetical protein